MLTQSTSRGIHSRHQIALESALVLHLPAGEYTAIVSGANGGTGIGLVEVYTLH